MLHKFLADNQLELIELCRAKVALRRESVAPNKAKLENGIPKFIDQIIRTLEAEHSSEPERGLAISGSGGGIPNASEIGTTAARHGRELLEHGYPVEQVVHDYGDLCQAITEMAVVRGELIEAGEFKTLNRCLDNAIADAVREFGVRRDEVFANSSVRSHNERMGFLAHELRNYIQTSKYAVMAIKSGYVGHNGATGGVLDRSLASMVVLIDRALAEVRVGSELPARREVISVAGFIAEAGFAASLAGKDWDCTLSVVPVDERLGIEVDRDQLSAAVSNLLQNAFKFTHAGSNVRLGARAFGDRILIEVSDHCGGLPPGSVERFFDPFTQEGKDKSGLGLGLSISRRSVEANLGTLSARDLPGIGCVFTIDLPAYPLPSQSVETVAALPEC